MEVKQQKSLIYILQMSKERAIDEKLKCEIEDEMTKMRIIMTNSSEIDPENRGFQNNGCQDLIKSINEFSKEIQERKRKILNFRISYIETNEGCTSLM